MERFVNLKSLSLVLLVAIIPAVAVPVRSSQDRPLTASNDAEDTKAKSISRAEVAAELFVERWHETLDMEILFEEMFVKDPHQRRLMVEDFWQRDGKPPIDYDILKNAYIAFLNTFCLNVEYTMLFTKENEEEAALPREVKQALRDSMKDRFDEDLETPESLIQFTVHANWVASLFRKHMAVGDFNSKLYQENLKDAFEEPEPSKVVEVAYESESRNRVSIQVQRGIFLVELVEEDGKWRVLDLDFGLK